MKTNKSLLIGLLGIAVLGLASCSAMDNVRGWFEKDETSAHPVKGQAGHYYLVGDKNFAGQENLAWKVQGGYEATEDKNGTDLAQFLNVKIKKNTAVKILKFVDGDNDIWNKVTRTSTTTTLQEAPIPSPLPSTVLRQIAASPKAPSP